MTEARAKFDVSGRVACVTGVDSGLGQRAAMTLAAAGAQVVGVARSVEVSGIWTDSAGASIAFVAADLSQRQEIGGIAARVSVPFGSPDIVVHAAGINICEEADDVTPMGWDATLDLNLAVPFFLTQALVPAMKAKGWGRVVTFASLHTTRALPASIAYGASKAGIGQLTRAMAEAWSSDGINVNAIGPSGFSTEQMAQEPLQHEYAAESAAQTCVGRSGTLADIDGPLLFLCSDASAFVTGQVLMVDGGCSAK